MPVTKTSIVDMIGFDVLDEGHLQVRISKITALDDQILSRENHRMMLLPDSDVDATIAANNEFLVSEGFTELSASDIADIKAVASRRWTAARKKKYRERQERDQARSKAR